LGGGLRNDLKAALGLLRSIYEYLDAILTNGITFVRIKAERANAIASAGRCL
jgi:hypothetical protein